MKAIELMVDEHKNIKKVLQIIRKACYIILETGEVGYDDFETIVDFIRNYADGHHHHKEEILLFNRMMENLGPVADKTIRHGMLVEHDLGRLYVKNLDEALKKAKEGNDEAKLDIIANAISYTDLLSRHIDKENNVIYKFAERELPADIMNLVDSECSGYEVENDDTRKKYLSVVKSLENKYL